MGVEIRENGADTTAVEVPVDPNTVVDAKGRTITLGKPSILRQYQILVVVGPEAAGNPTYMQVVMPLLWVQSIDGDKISFPTTKLQLESLITRLDDHGVSAVMAWMEGEVQRAASAGGTAKN